MQLLQSKISQTQNRLKRASKYNNCMSSASLKLQLQVLQDVYATYYIYAQKTAQKMMNEEE